MKKYTINEIETNENLFIHCSTEENWEKLKKACKNGYSTSKYYGNNFYNFNDGYYNPSPERTKIEFEQVIFEEEFVLPEKWYCLYKNREEFDIANKFFNGGWGFIAPTSNGPGFCNNKSKNHWWGLHNNPSSPQYAEYVQITFQQFKKYVLDMKEQEQQKEIVGYKLKNQQYREAAYKIAPTSKYLSSNDLISIEGNPYISAESLGVDLLKQAGVLDLWFEPVYKEEEKFKVGDWVKLSETANGWGAGSEICNAVVKLTESKKELYNEKVYFIHEGFKKRTNYNEISRLATPEEIKTAQYPQITVNGYKGEFFDEYVKFGRAEIDKDMFIRLFNVNQITYKGNKTNVESVTIGKGTFTKEQIKQIAEFYLNKNK